MGVGCRSPLHWARRRGCCDMFQLLHGAVFSKLNLVVNAGDSGEWNGADFEQDSDGEYPFAGEHSVSLAPPFPHAPLRAGTQTPALVFTARLHHVVLSAEPPSWCSPVALSRTATGVRTVRNED